MEEEKRFLQQDFLRFFVHELKTPISIILNFSQLLNRILKREDKKLFEKTEQMINAIYESAFGLKDYIENYFTIQSFEKGYQPKFEKVNICNILKQSIKKYQVLFNKECSISCNENMFIDSDEKLLRILFDNLLSNAFKFASSKIDIAVIKEENEIKVSICDDGKGIKEDEKEKIFKLYHKAKDNYSQQKLSGTGVGLYLVKKIVDMLGYEIEVKNAKEMGGACFTLSLSLVDGTEFLNSMKDGDDKGN